MQVKRIKTFNQQLLCERGTKTDKTVKDSWLAVGPFKGHQEYTDNACRLAVLLIKKTKNNKTLVPIIIKKIISRLTCVWQAVNQLFIPGCFQNIQFWNPHTKLHRHELKPNRSQGKSVPALWLKQPRFHRQRQTCVRFKLSQEQFVRGKNNLLRRRRWNIYFKRKEEFLATSEWLDSHHELCL